MPDGTGVDHASDSWPWIDVLETCVHAALGGAGGGSTMDASNAFVPQFHQPIVAAPPAVCRMAA